MNKPVKITLIILAIPAVIYVGSYLFTFGVFFMFWFYKWLLGIAG